MEGKVFCSPSGFEREREDNVSAVVSSDVAVRCASDEDHRLVNDRFACSQQERAERASVGHKRHDPCLHNFFLAKFLFMFTLFDQFVGIKLPINSSESFIWLRKCYEKRTADITTNCVSCR